MNQKIYIGPNIHALGLLKNQVYLDGIPGEVRASITRFPQISELIVPIDELPEAMHKISRKGEHLHHVAQNLLRKAGGN